jgi:uncharacterized membrane protein HdeD (DUF308 family)
MLKQLAKHRWICYVQGGLTLLFGCCLLYVQGVMFGQLATTLISAFVLLAGGFLLIVAGMLDLAVAIGITARMRCIRGALLWWMAGMLGLSTGFVLLFAPQFSVQLLAFFAAAHAALASAMDFCLIPSLRRHPLYRSLLVGSALIFLVFAAGLLLSAFSTDALAMQLVGVYAVYFGLRMIWVGHRLSHHQRSVAFRSSRMEIHARL